MEAGEPAEPAEIVDPAEAASPVDTAHRLDNEDPVEPAGTVEPVEAAEDVEAVESAEGVAAAEAVETPEPVQDVDSVEHVEAQAPVEAMEPMQPATAEDAAAAPERRMQTVSQVEELPSEACIAPDIVQSASSANARRGPVDENSIRSLFDRYAEGDMMPSEQLPQLLQHLDVDVDGDDLRGLLKACAMDENFMSFDELMALCVLLSVRSPTMPTSSSKKFLTQRRPYMESGHLGRESAIVSYMRKLEDHRLKCEREGKYTEAQAAAVRAHELRTAEAERRRRDMLLRHQSELQEVQRAFQQEGLQFNSVWDLRMKHYEEAFEKQAENLKQQHDMQLGTSRMELERRRPMRPKYSSELLNKRKIEGFLARLGEYERAHLVKEAADRMAACEMHSTTAAFEAEVRLKEAKVLHRQRQETEALVQKRGRGRAELEIQRMEQMERRVQRYRNVMAELQNLQRLEVVHLDYFLDSQAVAGKRDPPKESFFRKAATIPIF
eukprot:evm.model.scf_688.10 EVM.evm.TU.scf_688.10   scf_688:60923-64515(-)